MMSTTASPQSGLLPHLGVLRFTGPDSLNFLQGQVSNDTRRLAAGRGLLAAYSSPQGRVLALMHLLPHSSGIIAILPRELVLPTLEVLRRFVLRAKVNMDDASEVLGVSGQHGTHQLQSAGISAAPTGAGYAEKSDIGVGAVNHDAGRYWVVGAVDKLAERGLAARGLAGDPFHAQRVEQDWRFADIRAGLPQIYLATREAFVAQMLNLDLLDGISFSKGCYTGQEIIARTQHLGRIKRRLYRLQLPRGEWSIGQSLRLTDGRAGRLTEVIRWGDGACEALAVLTMQKLSAADDGDSAASAGDSAVSASVAATQLPLPYELQSPLE
jgi:folate-binding protein YgfZ